MTTFLTARATYAWYIQEAESAITEMTGKVSTSIHFSGNCYTRSVRKLLFVYLVYKKVNSTRLCRGGCLGVV